MNIGESYLDIVWKQFRKNRFAYWALWVVGALFLIAIFAPLIASDQPFVFKEGDQTLFPWFVKLFNPDTTVDFFFNMAMLVFFPWLGLSLIYNRLWKREQVPGRKRVLRSVGIFFAMLICTAAVCSQLKPSNKYADRHFKKEQLQGKGTGVYTIIAYGPVTDQDLDMAYKPPLSRKKGPSSHYRDTDIHILGTDDSGRDVLARLIYGSRVSMTVGFVAVSIYLTIGIIIGAMAGYFGGWVDITISRIIEVILLFPAFFLILTLVALIGPSIYIVMVVIGFTGWPTIARLIRGEFLKQRASEYVNAARALGVSNVRIMFRHILPNALSPALVAAPFGIAGAIVTEGALSLLGFGVRPPAPSWGAVLNLASTNYTLWWLILFPGLAIFFTVTVFNLVGNGLRDAMDPRLRI